MFITGNICMFFFSKPIQTCKYAPIKTNVTPLFSMFCLIIDLLNQTVLCIVILKDYISNYVFALTIMMIQIIYNVNVLMDFQ